jgi:TetR/AcrR family transcriptional regulator of autoinduction and epiphytic fitness
VKERLTAFLEQMAALVEESIYSACMPALIDAAERDPQVRDFHIRFSTERREMVIDLIRDGVKRGELPKTADPELLADALVGPILLRRIMLHAPMDPKLVRELVEQVLP